MVIQPYSHNYHLNGVNVFTLHLKFVVHMRATETLYMLAKQCGYVWLISAMCFKVFPWPLTPPRHREVYRGGRPVHLSHPLGCLQLCLCHGGSHPGCMFWGKTEGGIMLPFGNSHDLWFGNTIPVCVSVVFFFCVFLECERLHREEVCRNSVLFSQLHVWIKHVEVKTNWAILLPIVHNTENLKRWMCFSILVSRSLVGGQLRFLTWH